ncbi:PAQR family membrane homeostasis protein TrhA [Terrisporobacter petrolearius]|uniref:PAQR family membrane homeostasis protein TrhA n=1 Tax=Terrisporobacter petrolearius TaxID=1460447 RepID=UPI0031CCD6DD
MRTKLSDRKLPNYSIEEERFNYISHIVGGAIGVIALVLCVVIAAWHHDIMAIVTSVVYGITMILLYSMSSIYHGLKDGMAKKVFQVLDHCAIYILIAGTYTPIALCAVREVDPIVGWSIFIVEWSLAIIAIIFNAIDLKKYAVFSMICNLIMGWGIVVVVPVAIKALTWNGFMYILVGGIFYTVGAILYGIGRNKSYMHCIFHIFVLLGSIAHLFGIMFYVL